VTRAISHSVGRQSLQGDTTHKIRTSFRLCSNVHIALGSASPLRSHLSESTTKGSPETKTGRRYELDGGVWESLTMKALSSRAIQDFDSFLEMGK
jgi:hypothetical protein